MCRGKQAYAQGEGLYTYETSPYMRGWVYTEAQGRVC